MLLIVSNQSKSKLKKMILKVTMIPMVTPPKGITRLTRKGEGNNEGHDSRKSA